MDGRRQYPDYEVDCIGRTGRTKNNGAYKPTCDVRGRGIPNGMAYDNYDINDDFSETPSWNMKAHKSKQHWTKANRPDRYMWSNSLSDDLSHDEHRYRPKRHHARQDGVRHSPRDRRGRSTNIILACLVICMIVVIVATPLLIIFRGEPTNTEGTVNLELRLTDQFQIGMDDSTSAVFKSTEAELCTEVEQAVIAEGSFPRDTKYGCQLESLRNGSIIVTFVFTIYGRYTIPGNDMYVLAITSHVGVTGKLGSFTVRSGSIVVIAASYSTQGVKTIITTTTSDPTTMTTTPEPTTTTTTPEPTTTTTTPDPTTTTHDPTTTDIQLENSLTSPLDDLLIECNIKNAPNAWDEIKLMSSDVSIGIEAVGFANGTTQKDNNTYQLTFQPAESNMSLSLLFPNTTKHCFARNNYTCVLYARDNIFVETTEYISIPDEAENVEIIGNTTLNEGDSYVVNCTGDLAPPSSTLDLYTRTMNATSFTKSSVNPLVTSGDVTESCYLETTKSYTLIADRTDGGTELRCKALNASIGTAKMSEPKLVIVRVAEIEMNDSISTPGEELTISCNARYAPSGWDDLSVVSVDNDDIHAKAYSNGTIEQGNNSYIVTLQQDTPNMILSVLFPNTTTHCTARGSYVCTLTDNGIIVINDTATVIIADVASNLALDGNSTVKEGDRYAMNCSGRMAKEGGELHLYVRSMNTSDFARSTEAPVITVGEFNDSCYQSITKTYNFLAETIQNGTEFKCVATNDKLSSYQSSSSIDIVVDFADFSTNFHFQNTTWVPAYGDKSSQEFKSFAAQIENDTDYVYGQSALRDNYKKCKVTGLEPGSVHAIIVLFIEIKVTIIDSSNNVITTTLTASDIVAAFVDTIAIPSVSDNLSNSPLTYVETNSISGTVIITDPDDEYDCNTKIDVIFLLDASGSIGSSNFILMKYFIKNFTANVLLDPRALQVGITTFSTNPRYEFWLNEHYGVLTLNPAIDAIVYTSVGTYIAKGLEYVRDNSLAAANGARVDSRKVVILMTDGHSADNSATIASTLRNNGVLVACVGIGNGINMGQLNDIAYNSSYIFFATDFNVLTQIKDTVKGASCGTDNNSNNNIG